MAAKALSSKQKRIISFIHDFLRQKGYPPVLGILLRDAR
ncbi:MAG: hypothetical protein KAV98_01450 [Dehalococcoidia bacterium]|nr:hypothetical protein [Dehalococcoidia bacterium]